MQDELLLEAFERLRAHVNRGFEEAEALIRARMNAKVESEPEKRRSGMSAASTWNPTALDMPLPEGSFRENDPPRSGVTFRWPDNNVDHYREFQVYEGTGGFAPQKFAIGRKADGECAGFALGPDGKAMRGITSFQVAEDFATTQELVSFIRGGGSSGKAGFEESADLPKAYEAFRTQPLGERLSHGWNRQAVVVRRSDTDAMLRHTFAQARLRGIL